MPSDDYSAAVSGGLKLKGVNSSSKVSKHKKKKPKPAQSADSETAEKAKNSASAEGLKPDGEDSEAITRRSQDGSIEKDEEVTSPPARVGKTEAELRHEERRRKRVGFPPDYFASKFHFIVLTVLQLDERLKREGTKTHKERVEELNRYLSNLSEHHDMYVYFVFYTQATRIATDMFFYLGRGSDLDDSPVGCAWDMANRSTRNFPYYKAMEGSFGRQVEGILVKMEFYLLMKLLVRVRRGSTAVESRKCEARYTKINHH